MSKPFDDKPVRFLRKDVNNNERLNYDGWWDEQIQMYGTETTYYTSGVTLESHDSVYGEEPTAKFENGKKLILALNLNENAIVMQKFGLVADDEVTAFIHIKNFYTVFGDNEEPKSGDVFDLSEFGDDRPGGRGGKHFEITERIDQDVQQINPLIGHYVWLIKAKRHDYSFEPVIPKEDVSTQVEDNVREESLNIFNYPDYGDNDDVYGGYV
jgi:hypothetical protein